MSILIDVEYVFFIPEVIHASNEVILAKLKHFCCRYIVTGTSRITHGLFFVFYVRL